MGNKAYKPTVKDRLEKLEKKVKKQDKQIRGLLLFNVAETTAKLVSDSIDKNDGVPWYQYPNNNHDIIAEKQMEIELKKAEIDLLQAEIKELKK